MTLYKPVRAPPPPPPPPPPYESMDSLGVAAAVIAVLAAIVVGAVVETELNEYPDYSSLSYTLTDTYSGTDFFDNFDYFTGYDPTSGFVHYVDSSVATSQQYNLTYASSESAVLRVDASETDASTGRYSVRITSKKHTWPALWPSDPNNSPENGEIDVMEAVNQGNIGNQMTLHTTSGCKMNVKRKETGDALYKNCKNTTNDNAGCGVMGGQDTYGESFNDNGGGIYAMEWPDQGIRVCFFSRHDIPSDIPDDVSNTTAPDPSTWGEALADFPSTHCDISSHFRDQSIIANIDLCGTWAGSEAVYTTEYGCPGECSQFVATNNTAFETAVWEWKSWRVYTAN
ncbi:hypothetical protein AC579_10401 [Pseudocercospora musae]|uniref:GH16 domain-containing protein n=1 Tax=Pseudocercospora musae TaxID=113226 RepID=A0A139IMP9_9PEZI|nr:hypothetical protein AC579_10401 [Pseudocercospora musae]KXT15843.1 hypothetical protein AC579_10401 [Pseudocercospora musae]